MNTFLSYLQKTYDFSNFEVKKIRYALIAFTSELSKLLLLGVFFAIQSQLLGFIVATIILMLVRCNMGGIHCKSYLNCFALTFILMFLAVTILPTYVATNIPFQLCTLTACILANTVIGPIQSIHRTPATKEKLRKNKTRARLYIIGYTIAICLFPSHTLLDVGFWTIVLQTLQLCAAKFLKEKSHTIRRNNLPRHTHTHRIAHDGISDQENKRLTSVSGL